LANIPNDVSGQVEMAASSAALYIVGA